MEKLAKLMNGDDRCTEDDLMKIKQALANLKTSGLIDYEIHKSDDGGDDVVSVRLLHSDFDFSEVTVH
ncbi:MAG: hypothetical protein K2P99_04775 [Burkholderiales bacterium]|nr:hypothetical protein [Burkholderiales bacterium]